MITTKSIFITNLNISNNHQNNDIHFNLIHKTLSIYLFYIVYISMNINSLIKFFIFLFLWILIIEIEMN